VILRAPLVYGAGVKGNFLDLLRLIDRGIPLPVGAIRNQRSLIYLGNLVDSIVRCVEHPAAAGRTYLLSDGEDVSTPELIKRLAAALGRPARLVPVSPWLLKVAGRALGKAKEVNRLTGSLQVDSSHIRDVLGWTPPYSMDQGLAATAAWYRELTGR